MFRSAAYHYQRFRRATIRVTLSTAVAVGVVEVTTHLPSQGRSSETYHFLCDECVTPLLRRFLDPEVAHQVALYMTQKGWGPLYRPSASEQRVRMETSLWSDGRSGGSCSSKTFPNPIGLAAGFDKDGYVIPEMLQLGFGFVEIGTVTPMPQSGNPRPRMWRLVHDQALINRYGFNSAGSAVVQQNLKQFRDLQQQLQQQKQEQMQSATTTTTSLGSSIWNAIRPYFISYLSSSYPSSSAISKGLVGVNIGKNKNTQGDEAILADYVSNLEQLGPLADYIVINISSPNTPGLTDLQTQPWYLRKLLQACLDARDRVDPSLPLLLKISPDLSQDQLLEIAQVCMQLNVDGLVVCNTTTARPSDLISWKLQHPSQLPPPSTTTTIPTATTSRTARTPPPSSEEDEADDELNENDAGGMISTSTTLDTSSSTSIMGGLSGAPLKDTSTECIRTLFRATKGTIPIIGVGGVGSGRDALEKMQAGASLVQVYSMMVYQGPGVVSRIRKELAELMIQNGKRSVEELVGMDHEDLYWERREARLRLHRRRDSRSVVTTLSSSAEDTKTKEDYGYTSSELPPQPQYDPTPQK